MMPKALRLRNLRKFERRKHEAPIGIQRRTREVTDFPVVVGSKSLDLVQSQLPQLISDCA